MPALPNPDIHIPPASDIRRPKFTHPRLTPEKPGVPTGEMTFTSAKDFIAPSDRVEVSIAGKTFLMVKGSPIGADARVAFFPVLSPTEEIPSPPKRLSSESGKREEYLGAKKGIAGIEGYVFDQGSKRYIPIVDLKSFQDGFDQIVEELRDLGELDPSKYTATLSHMKLEKEKMLSAKNQQKIPFIVLPETTNERVLRPIHGMLRDVIEKDVEALDKTREKDTVKNKETEIGNLPPIGQLMGSMLEAGRDPFKILDLPVFSSVADVDTAYGKAESGLAALMNSKNPDGSYAFPPGGVSMELVDRTQQILLQTRLEALDLLKYTSLEDQQRIADMSNQKQRADELQTILIARKIHEFELTEDFKEEVRRFEGPVVDTGSFDVVGQMSAILKISKNPYKSFGLKNWASSKEIDEKRKDVESLLTEVAAGNPVDAASVKLAEEFREYIDTHAKIARFTTERVDQLANIGSRLKNSPIDAQDGAVEDMYKALYPKVARISEYYAPHVA